MTFRRQPGVHQQVALKPGEYRKSPENDSHWAVVCCSSCAKMFTLAKKTHKVDDLGRVTPAIACPKDSCDFEEVIVLASWGDN
jgi:hypothetical protein